MGKTTNAKSNGSNKSGNSGRQGSVGENTKRTEIAREQKSKRAALLDARRDEERQEGTFYLRVNAGRSNDIVAACAGQTGNYAVPGADQPSMHFNVQKEVGAKGAMSVVRLESIQEGHECHGTIFNPLTFIPCFYIEKFGQAFTSRQSDRLSAATQEFICRYFSQLMASPQGEDMTDEVPAEEYHAAEPSENLAAGLDGVSGLYRYTNDKGTVVLGVYQTKYPVVEIVESTIPDVATSKIFLPLHVMKLKKLGGDLPEEVMIQQRSIYHLLNEIAEKVAPIVTAVAAKQEKVIGAKELAKAGKRKAMKIAIASEKATVATTLAVMQAQTIKPIQAVSGKLGYVDMSDKSGELIVLFGKNGNDHVVTVAFIGEHHQLRLAGIDVGNFVYGGQVMKGLIDRMDASNLRLSQDEVKKGNVLIGYIRSQFETRHVILPARKGPDLKKVA
jgi:hypothetical protein